MFSLAIVAAGVASYLAPKMLPFCPKSLSKVHSATRQRGLNGFVKKTSAPQSIAQSPTCPSEQPQENRKLLWARATTEVARGSWNVFVLTGVINPKPAEFRSCVAISFI